MSEWESQSNGAPEVRQAVEEDRLPRDLRRSVGQLVRNLKDVARWIGQVTLAASHFQLEEGPPKRFVRDSDPPARVRRATASRAPRGPAEPGASYSGSGPASWRTVLQRAQPPSGSSAELPLCRRAVAAAVALAERGCEREREEGDIARWLDAATLAPSSYGG